MNQEIDALLRQLADEDVRHEARPHVEAAVMREWRSHKRPVASFGSWVVGGGSWAALRRSRVVGHGWWTALRGSWAGAAAAAAMLIATMMFWPNAGAPTISHTVPQTILPDSSGAHAETDPTTSAPRIESDLSPNVPAAKPGTAQPATVAATTAVALDPRPATYHPASTTESPSSAVTEQPSYLLVGAPPADAPLSIVRLRMARSALATLGLPLPNPDAAALVDVDVFVGEDGVARAIRPVALVSSVSQE